MSLLSIRNLHASIGDKEILKGVNLEINKGEVHSIMGPNGNGKSTLAAVVAGNSKFTVTQGEIIFKGKNLLEMPIDVRAAEGIFLGFQYPVEIPGVSISNFMRTAVNEQRKYRGLDPLSASDFLKLMEEKKTYVGFPPAKDGEPHWVEVKFKSPSTIRAVEFPGVQSLNHAMSFEPNFHVTAYALLADGSKCTIIDADLPPSSWQDRHPMTFACPEVKEAVGCRVEINNSIDEIVAERND